MIRSTLTFLPLTLLESIFCSLRKWFQIARKRKPANHVICGYSNKRVLILNQAFS
jgi:hypothetical protein